MKDEILQLLEQSAEIEETRDTCKIKINRGEVPAIRAYMMGKDEGARLLALSILALLEAQVEEEGRAK